MICAIKNITQNVIIQLLERYVKPAVKHGIQEVEIPRCLRECGLTEPENNQEQIQ